MTRPAHPSRLDVRIAANPWATVPGSSRGHGQGTSTQGEPPPVGWSRWLRPFPTRALGNQHCPLASRHNVSSGVLLLAALLVTLAGFGAQATLARRGVRGTEKRRSRLRLASRPRRRWAATGAPSRRWVPRGRPQTTAARPPSRASPTPLTASASPTWSGGAGGSSPPAAHSTALVRVTSPLWFSATCGCSATGAERARPAHATPPLGCES